jgi:class 3 adenylate cyclase/CHASE2 domain-containing sensor protein
VTANQKSLLQRTFLLGAMMTLLVIGLDRAGALKPIEDHLYNWRVRYCQRFTPAPTVKLIHLDIDDESLESIGRWPWHRTTIAEIIDELRLAGAKAICLDMTLPDREAREYVPGADGTLTTVDHDANFAAAVKRHGAVLVPVSFAFNPMSAGSPELRVALVEELRKNLSLTPDGAHELLKGRFPTITLDDFLAARRQAVQEGVERILGSSGDSRTTPPATTQIAAQLLLPGTGGGNDAGLVRLIENETDLYQSKRAIERFGHPLNEPLRHVLEPSGELLMIPPLAQATAYTGFVDHLPFGDGVVRTVPLWVLYRNRLYPQMGLSLACAALGVDANRIRVTDTSVMLPMPDGREMVVPVRGEDSPRLNRRVGILMDVPWWGTNEWETMYDFPASAEKKQHVSIGAVWKLGQTRKVARANFGRAQEALKFFSKEFGVDRATKYLASTPNADDVDSLNRAMEATLAEVKPSLEPLEKSDPRSLQADERVFFNYAGVLRQVLEENAVLRARQAAVRELFNEKSVLIGSVATSAADFVATPLHAQCPGVVVHGAVFNAIMTGRVLRSSPPGVAMVLTLIMGLLVTAAVAFFSPTVALGVTALLITGYMGINGFVLFDYGKNMVGMAGPVMAGGFVWGGMTLTRYIVERAERARITSRFRSYVDEQLVDFVLEHPHRDIFEGEEQELTVAFTDMAGFTTLMEKMGTKIVPILNEYMGRMVPVIQNNGGYVNKFLGDGIMFFYGAPRPNPDHAARAVTTVLEMQLAIRSFNEWLKEQGQDPVAVRAGVATGFMIVGDAGPRKRSDYTVLGDSVNLSSRLESANKHVGTSSMISGRTAELLNGTFLLRPIGKIQVVGKSETVMVFEPLALNDQATDEQKKFAEMTKRMVDAFTAGQFQECLEAIAAAEEAFGKGKLFTMYAQACAVHIANPPSDFDGRITLAEK